MILIGPTSSLASVQRWVRNKIDKGHGFVCPACGRFGKRYDRQISAGNARFLIQLCYLTGGDTTRWVDVPTEIPTPGGDYGKLRHWGLIEPSDIARGDGSRRSGWWRITEKGVSFARAHTAVPKYALVYDDALEGFDGPLVWIQECLGKKFDYNELMYGSTNG